MVHTIKLTSDNTRVWLRGEWLAMTKAKKFAPLLTTLITSAYKQCEKLHINYLEIYDAPQHISVIAHDLQDFCLVFGTLEALLHHIDPSARFNEVVVSRCLYSVLTDCLWLFKDINIFVAEYQAHYTGSIANWQDQKGDFKKSKFVRLRKELIGCKAGFNVAIPMIGL